MKHSIKLVVAIIVIVGAIMFLENSRIEPVKLAGDVETNQIEPLANIEEKTVVTEPIKEVKNEVSSDTETLHRIEMKKLKYKQAPELRGISGYLNTDKEIKISDYRGKVVLIDMWTFSCINCIRTLPYVTSWDEKYRDEGLVIIGVHTPEFDFEKDINNVREAIAKHGIEYPVVQDNNYETWRAFKNRYWPRKYLIDMDGFIRYDHIGEGSYDETEEMIQTMLAEIDVIDDELV